MSFFLLTAFALFRNIMKKILIFSRTEIVSMKFDIFQVSKFNIIWYHQMKHIHTHTHTHTIVPSSLITLNHSLKWFFLFVDWHFVRWIQYWFVWWKFKLAWSNLVPSQLLAHWISSTFSSVCAILSLSLYVINLRQIWFDLFGVIDTTARHCKWSIQLDQVIWWVLIKLL
jgi:hypothetical protein